MQHASFPDLTIPSQPAGGKPFLRRCPSCDYRFVSEPGSRECPSCGRADLRFDLLRFAAYAAVHQYRMANDWYGFLETLHDSLWQPALDLHQPMMHFWSWMARLAGPEPADDLIEQIAVWTWKADEKRIERCSKGGVNSGKVRRNQTADRDRSIIGQYLDGDSTKVIAERHGVSQRTVQRVIKRPVPPDRRHEVIEDPESINYEKYEKEPRELPRTRARGLDSPGCPVGSPDQHGGTMTQHPLSSIFPQLPDDEYRRLVEDIKKNGVLNAVIAKDDQIIDGWHRYRASQEAGIECPIRYVASDADLRQVVVSANVHRRHLSAADRVRLVDEVMPGLSTREAAHVAKVGHMTVHRARNPQPAVPNDTPAPADVPVPNDTPADAAIEEPRLAGTAKKYMDLARPGHKLVPSTIDPKPGEGASAVQQLEWRDRERTRRIYRSWTTLNPVQCSKLMELIQQGYQPYVERIADAIQDTPDWYARQKTRDEIDKLATDENQPRPPIEPPSPPSPTSPPVQPKEPKPVPTDQDKLRDLRQALAAEASAHADTRVQCENLLQVNKAMKAQLEGDDQALVNKLTAEQEKNITFNIRINQLQEDLSNCNRECKRLRKFAEQ